MTDTDALPAAAIGARIGAAVTVRGETRLRLYPYGAHPDVPNPGHVLMVARTDGLELAVMLRGRDMAALARVASAAAALYDTEREWLDAPVTRLLDADGPAA